LENTIDTSALICQNKNSNLKIRTYDSDLIPLKANIYYECVGSNCQLGETSLTAGGFYEYDGDSISCVNGVVTASADGYGDAKIIASSGKDSVLDIILYKEYNISLDIQGVSEDDNILINFDGDNEYSNSLMYPETKTILLYDGNYNITAYVYSGNKITFPAISTEYCTEDSGSSNLLTDAFGLDLENCYTINTSSMELDNVLIGGGNIKQYFTDDMLKKSTTLKITPVIYNTPSNMDELQSNYLKLESSKLNINLS
jgi:hypothetical protein